MFVFLTILDDLRGGNGRWRYRKRRKRLLYLSNVSKNLLSNNARLLEIPYSKDNHKKLEINLFRRVIKMNVEDHLVQKTFYEKEFMQEVGNEHPISVLGRLYLEEQQKEVA